MTNRMQKMAGIALLSGSLLAGGIAVSLPSVAGAAVAATANSNFKGSWALSNGQGFVITQENRTTGACRGTTDLGPPYALIDCKVTGHKYVFTITFGSTYKSFNVGNIHGDNLSGRFHDTNGSTGTYTGTSS